MGWFKRVKKAVKRIGGKTVMKPIKSLKDLVKPKDEPEEVADEGTRSAAANQLIKQSVNRQAGSGQINFTEEKESGV